MKKSKALKYIAVIILISIAVFSYIYTIQFLKNVEHGAISHIELASVFALRIATILAQTVLVLIILLVFIGNFKDIYRKRIQIYIVFVIVLTANSFVYRDTSNKVNSISASQSSIKKLNPTKVKSNCLIDKLSLLNKKTYTKSEIEKASLICQNK